MNKLQYVFLYLTLFNTAYSQEANIISWNIKMLPKICNWFGSESLSEKYERLDSIIVNLKNSEADVILLQEVFDVTAVNKLKNQLKDIYPYTILPESNFFKISNGLMILSKFELQKNKTIFYTKSRFQDAFSSKGAVLYTTNIHHQKLYLINTHLQSDYDFCTSVNVRKSQLEQINQELVDDIVDKETPIILAGDFNFDENSIEYDYSFSSFPLMKDVQMDTGDESYTYSDKNYWNEGIKPQKLDYFFTLDLHNIIQVNKFQIHTNYLFNNIDCSDHYCLSLTASFAKKLLAKY